MLIAMIVTDVGTVHIILLMSELNGVDYDATALTVPSHICFNVG